MTAQPPPGGPPAPAGPTAVDASPPESPPAKRTGRIVLIVIIGAVIFLGLIGAVVWGFWSRSPASAVVGDCLSYSEQTGSLRKVPCDDPAANYRLYGLTDSIRACADVLGTTYALDSGSRTYCFGEKNADPATAINGVRRGDCVTVAKDDARKSACVKRSYPVLAVLKDQLKSSAGKASLAGLCGRTKGTSVAYGWSISTTEDQPVGTWDRVLCLGAPRR